MTKIFNQSKLFLRKICTFTNLNKVVMIFTLGIITRYFIHEHIDMLINMIVPTLSFLLIELFIFIHDIFGNKNTYILHMTNPIENNNSGLRHPFAAFKPERHPLPTSRPSRPTNQVLSGPTSYAQENDWQTNHYNGSTEISIPNQYVEGKMSLGVRYLQHKYNIRSCYLRIDDDQGRVFFWDLWNLNNSDLVSFKEFRKSFLNNPVAYSQELKHIGPLNNYIIRDIALNLHNTEFKN